jgi:hypothetical protein
MAERGKAGLGTAGPARTGEAGFREARLGTATQANKQLRNDMAINLKSISKTRRREALKMLVSGQEKVGKSSLAASAPNPIAIATEDGLAGLDTESFPLAKSLDDVYSAIGTLLNEEHNYKTVFVDSLDWLEPLIQAHVCAVNKWDSIESPGFGKGYVAAANEWRTLLDGLEALRTQRNMNVILICHVKQKRVETPTAEGYDAFVLKLNDRAAGLVQEWADIIGFCAHKIIVKRTDGAFGDKQTKAITTQQRMLYLEPHPAYPSGNRFNLKDCPLSWDAFAEQLNQQPAALAA